MINFELSNCEISFDAAKGAHGAGKLYITSKRVLWIGETVDSAFDYDVAYVVLHAVTRDEESYPKPCVYCQLDVEEEEQDDEEITTELFLVPADEAALMKIFDALSHAALLNPDPEEEGDEFLGDFVFDENEIAEGSEQARILNHLESVFVLTGDEKEEGDYDEEDEQFADAEEEGENGASEQKPQPDQE